MTLLRNLKVIDEIGGPKARKITNPVGWAWAGSSPFPMDEGACRRIFGGTRNGNGGFAGPAKIKDRGGLRTPVSIMSSTSQPTIYEVAGP